MRTLLLFLALLNVSVCQITWQPYSLKPRTGAPVTAEIAYFEVPQFHARADSSKIKLAVVRLKTTAPTSSLAPVVFLAGGPGGSGITQAGEDVFLGAIQELRSAADVLLLDQRGTGLAEPSLECPDPLKLPVEESLTEEGWLALMKSFAEKCKAAVQKRGVDLNAYNTEESADDVDALRKALKLPKVSLFGFSYGTHLAMSVLRRHPSSIEAAILAGVEGPDHSLKLPANSAAQIKKISQLVAADPYWGSKLPDFEASLAQGLKLLEKPVTVEVKHPREGTTHRVAISATDLRMAMVDQMGKKNSMEFWPGSVYRLAKGDFSNLGTLSLLFRSSSRKITAMTFSMDCASSASAARRKLVQEQLPLSPLGRFLDFPIQPSCPFWGVRTLPDAFRLPVTSSVRTLFISGVLDGRTPPSNAAEVAAGFKSAHQLVVTNASHTELVSYPPVQKAMSDFLKGTTPPTALTVAPLAFKKLEEMRF